MSIDQSSALLRHSATADGLSPASLHPLARAASIVGAGLLVGCILFFLILPTLLIIPMSLSQTDYIQFPPQGLTWHWYSAYFSDPDWMAATWFSVRIAIATTVSATIIGTMASLAIVRGDLPFKGTLQALTVGPMIVPHIVFGVALYLVFSPLQLTGSFIGFLIAHTFHMWSSPSRHRCNDLTRCSNLRGLAVVQTGCRSSLELCCPILRPALRRLPSSPF